MRSTTFSLSMLAVATLAGCSRGNSKLVGTWQTNAGGAHSEYHFYPDGHFTMQTRSGPDVANVEGSAKVEDGRLMLAPAKGDVQGPDEQLAAQMRSVINQRSQVPMRWNNPLSFTLTMNDGTPGLNFNRISDKP